MLTGKSVLIVEDEFLVASMLEGMLEDHGCRDVVIASNLPAAFDAIGKFRFDAVVLDVNLDGKPSEAFAEHLLQNSIPFLFSTGYDSGSLADRWKSFPFLQKPYTDADLQDALEKLFKK